MGLFRYKYVATNARIVIGKPIPAMTRMMENQVKFMGASGWEGARDGIGGMAPDSGPQTRPSRAVNPRPARRRHSANTQDSLLPARQHTNSWCSGHIECWGCAGRAEEGAGCNLRNDETIIGPTDDSANPRISCSLSSVGSRCYRWVLFSIVSPVKLPECFVKIESEGGSRSGSRHGGRRIAIGAETLGEFRYP